MPLGVCHANEWISRMAVFTPENDSCSCSALHEHDHAEFRIMRSKPGKRAYSRASGECLLRMMGITGNRGRPAQNRRA